MHSGLRRASSYFTTSSSTAAHKPYSEADASDVKPGHGPTYAYAVHAPTPECSNMLDYFLRSVARNPSRDCLGHRPRDADGNVGAYVWQTYDQVCKRIQALAAGLMHHEMLVPTTDTNERVLGIFMKNRPEWTIAHYAAIYTGGFCVALYDTLGADATPFVLNQTQASTLVCTTAELAKVVAAAAHASTLKHIVLCDVTTKSDEATIAATTAGLALWTMAEVEASGTEHPMAQSVARQGKDIYCLIYTSGTTGEPKGVPLSHDNLVHAIEACKERMSMGQGAAIFKDTAVAFSYLPLAHSIEHLIEASTLVHSGKIAYYQGDTTKILDDLALVRPTVFGVVPRLLNKIYDKVVHAAQGSGWVGGAKTMLFRAALYAKLQNLKLGFRRHPIFDPLIFAKIQLKVGLDRCGLVIVGSAPLSHDVMDFFRVLFSCPVIEGYGLSEVTGIATLNLPTQCTPGDVGPPLASVQAKLVSVSDMGYEIGDLHHGDGDHKIMVRGRGEVCLRGPTVFSGYYKRPEATVDAIDADGWFHTGDIGVWLPDGRLKIVDRKKNIFKLSQGEYVAPERIENILGTSTHVEQVFVYGDSLHAILVAVVVPAEEPLRTLVAPLDGTLEELCQHPEVGAAVLKELVAVSKASKLFGFETIKAIKLHHVQFTVENNLLTPTFKLKRNECKKFFDIDIDAMYGQCGDLVAGVNVKQS
ncbi:Aste57867_19197 [Aphanomyces stellatus]|uniref:Aste57867_19197 protein n=1 Tax=Aphanomyces stellatus TaxID=120398 RepID=A0A485LCM7_9STRA|nr:hypothetical protein As57867_019133 [Aphanomyces stellatus]VFT95918.1 Aste57867_19197 [Aphanomyces stellatus]